MIKKFDNRHSPIFRWDCEDLLESSGHGLHLTGATAIFRQVYKDTLGLSPPVVVNRNGTSDTILRDYDDLTIQILGVMRAVLTSNTYILAFQSSGETEPTNYTWSVTISQSAITYFAEYANGQDTSYAATVPGRGLPAVGVPFNLAMRRKAVAGGVIIQFFLNGLPYGPPSGVLTAPTGGTTDQLVFNQGAPSGVDLIAVEIDNALLSDAQLLEAYNYTMGDELGYRIVETQSLWVGATTDEGATVAVRLTHASDDVCLAVTGPGGTVLTPSIALAHGEPAKFVIDGLIDDVEYTYDIHCDGLAIEGPIGRFRTLPSGNPAQFTVAFGGDAATASNAEVFDTIREMDPVMLVHMGDAHYHNYGTNNQAQFHAAFDEILAQSRQAQLYREIATVYGWDDHDSGPNNHDASAASIPAVAAVYRQRVPHYPLPDTLAVYQTWDIGRVRFVLTDQRTYASPNSATDNASKTMLGLTQKNWFKNILNTSSGYLIVWICPRWFGTPQTAGIDSWGGFSTERAELASYIHSHCSGRVVVLSADVHGMGIDDGSHHDFLPGGGEPLPCFQASPFDIAAPAMAGTYSEGTFAINGVFGTMRVEDAGGDLDVTWTGYDTSGTQLTTLSFTVAL